jgi:hypothetical protein
LKVEIEVETISIHINEYLSESVEKGAKSWESNKANTIVLLIALGLLGGIDEGCG